MPAETRLRNIRFKSARLPLSKLPKRLMERHGIIPGIVLRLVGEGPMGTRPSAHILYGDHFRTEAALNRFRWASKAACTKLEKDCRESYAASTASLRRLDGNDTALETARSSSNFLRRGCNAAVVIIRRGDRLQPDALSWQAET